MVMIFACFILAAVNSLTFARKERDCNPSLVYENYMAEDPVTRILVSDVVQTAFIYLWYAY